VSNPPYVRDGDRAGIQPEVRCEPAVALYGGADGLDVIRRLLAGAVARLKQGGTLLFEFAYGYDDAVSELIASAAGLTMIGLRHDLQDIPRIAITQRT
jgi:release factor glutamine methyltransferase